MRLTGTRRLERCGDCIINASELGADGSFTVTDARVTALGPDAAVVLGADVRLTALTTP